MASTAVWQLEKLPTDKNGTKILVKEQSQNVEENLEKLDDIFGVKRSYFVDTMVAPACETLFLNSGFTSFQVSQMARKKLNGETLQIDLFVTNESLVLAVGVKSTLTVEDIQYFMEDLGQFKQFFPEYSHKQLYGGVSGIKIEKGADKYATRQGLFVLAQSGETMTILNGTQFEPKSW